jgi:hypothetical protein
LTKEHFDVLGWWKGAGTRYPTLRKVARDISVVPASTVASESAFSTSGRVLSEHRSRLTSDLLEALMCSQDWLKNKYKGIYVWNNSSLSFKDFLGATFILARFIIKEYERNSFIFFVDANKAEAGSF